MSRSSRTACSKEPPKSAERGCLRRVSLKRRTKILSAASKNRMRKALPSWFRDSAAVKKALNSSPPRVSVTTATLSIALSDLRHKS